MRGSAARTPTINTPAPGGAAINRIDLARHVGASLEVMDRDARKMRGEPPFVSTSLNTGQGLDQVIAFIEKQGMLRH